MAGGIKNLGVGPKINLGKGGIIILFIFSALKLHSIWISQTTKSHLIWCSRQPNFNTFCIPNKQISLHFDILENCLLHFDSSGLGRQVGVKFCCWQHQKRVKLSCWGHNIDWNLLGICCGICCWGHLQGMKI